MLAYIGEFMLGGSFFVILAVVHWFRKHQDWPPIDTWMIAEFAALAITCLVVSSLVLTIRSFVGAYIEQNYAGIGVGLATVAAGLFMAIALQRILSRSARSTLPLAGSPNAG